MTALPVRPGPQRSREPGPQRLREMLGKVGWGIVAWVVAIAFFLPVLWMVITAFKPESAAETWPPKFVFHPTLAEFLNKKLATVETFQSTRGVLRLLAGVPERDADAHDGFLVVPADDLRDNIALLGAQPDAFLSRRAAGEVGYRRPGHKHRANSAEDAAFA